MHATIDCVFVGHTNFVAFLTIIVYRKSQLNGADNASVHLSFCRKFLFLTYPSQRKRDLLSPSQRKKQKNKTQKI